MSRKYLKIEGFWPLHFSIFPPLIIASFSMLGILEGIGHGLYFEYRMNNYVNQE